MGRKSSLAAPLPLSNSTSSRRRSANGRLDNPVSTPETPASTESRVRGSSLYLPITISDGEVEEEKTPDRRKSRTQTTQGDASPPRPTSAKVPRSRQQTTPDYARIAPRRDVATDPGKLSTPRLKEYDDKAIPYRPATVVHQDGSEDEREKNGNIIDESYSDKDIKQNGTDKGKESSAQRVHAKLLKQARKQLTKGEEEGHIYIFCDPKKRGILKIGRTKHVDERFKRHMKCGLQVEEVYISHLVQHVKRAESLVKIDLSHLCRPWQCFRCSEEHGEWFKVGPAKAKEVVNQWVTWINKQNPYGNDKNMKPIWNDLLSHGRQPEEVFEHQDHAARWAHWAWALSPPSSKERKLFDKLNDRGQHVNEKTQMTPKKHDNDGKKIIPYRQPPSTEQTAPLTLTDLAKALVSKDQTVHIHITGNVNITTGCKIIGDASVRRLLQG
ncbi:hypothetical protein N0V83_002466 [Neocucurbitaria cava]|uniref:Bacteriophage T5 Orf172 DNA-binding domain-containing protein n=1 Tax=Neocucurbitaria cava TaxID=798079 RepID=A0A9W9CQ27_9PLEO|nr:hypothetical protein N0V83_002466 [Neocucurbitaria cava]